MGARETEYRPNTIIVTIHTGDAAFEDAEGPEVGDILKRIAEDMRSTPRLNRGDYPLRDSNGNTVGGMRICPE